MGLLQSVTGLLPPVMGIFLFVILPPISLIYLLIVVYSLCPSNTLYEVKLRKGNAFAIHINIKVKLPLNGEMIMQTTMLFYRQKKTPK
jgi:hypothetical protein